MSCVSNQNLLPDIQKNLLIQKIQKPGTQNRPFGKIQTLAVIGKLISVSVSRKRHNASLFSRGSWMGKFVHFCSPCFFFPAQTICTSAVLVVVANLPTLHLESAPVYDVIYKEPMDPA